LSAGLYGVAATIYSRAARDLSRSSAWSTDDDEMNET